MPASSVRLCDGHERHMGQQRHCLAKLSMVASPYESEAEISEDVFLCVPAMCPSCWCKLGAPPLRKGPFSHRPCAAHAAHRPSAPAQLPHMCALCVQPPHVCALFVQPLHVCSSCAAHGTHSPSCQPPPHTHAHTHSCAVNGAHPLRTPMQPSPAADHVCPVPHPPIAAAAGGRSRGAHRIWRTTLLGGRLAPPALRADSRCMHGETTRDCGLRVTSSSLDPKRVAWTLCVTRLLHAWLGLG